MIIRCRAGAAIATVVGASLVYATAAALIFACSIEPPASFTPDSGASGAEGQPCANGVCNAGLTCASGVCVKSDAGNGGDGGVADAASDGDVDANGLRVLGPSSDAYSIVVNSTDVYWTTYQSDGAVFKCAVGGCGGAPTVFYSGKVSGDASIDVPVRGIAIDSTSVYWVAYPGQGAWVVLTCALAGCGGAPTIVASGSGSLFPEGLAVDGTTVYWTTSASGTVMKCAKGGCSNSPTTLASGQTSPYGIVVDSTSVYWINWGSQNGSVMKCPLVGCGGNPTILASGPTSNHIAVNGTDVFWASDDGSVLKCAKGGCGGTPTTVNAPSDGGAPGTLGAVALDSTSVYWSGLQGSSGGSLMKCPLAGCVGAPTVLKAGNCGTQALAVDDTSVYFSAFDTKPSIDKLTPK